MIQHSLPLITGETLSAVKEVLDSKMLAHGAVVESFEKGITDYIGGYETACVGSGGAAILLALNALNIGINDEVIFPTYVCRSVIEAVLTSGAKPVLCDVDENWVVSYRTIYPVVTKRTRAIIVPHVYGIKADVGEISKLGIPIIEDCAQAFGKTINNKKIGLDAELSIFSFHPTKCLTTGEGGAIMLNKKAKTLREKVFALRDGESKFTRRIFSPMSDISATIGLVQLKNYDAFLDRRFQIARRYDEVLLNKKSIKIINSNKIDTMYFRYVLKTDRVSKIYFEKFEREGIVTRRGVDLLLHSITGDNKTFKNSEFLFNHTLSLPIYPSLTEDEVLKILNAVDIIFN